jgi:amino acid transporter
MEHHDGDGGISRTLYQGSKVGWLPRYLSHANAHGAPTHAMWTDFGFNLFLLAIASDIAGYFFVLAVSNVGYIIFNYSISMPAGSIAASCWWAQSLRRLSFRSSLIDIMCRMAAASRQARSPISA